MPAESNLPLVSIIIATHNGAEFIGPCLSALDEQDYPNTEVIFVDNASTDGCAELVRTGFPTVRVIESRQNLGYGGGNNRGAAAATGELLLFLNHDTLVGRGFLTELVGAMQSDPTIGLAQSKILKAADPNVVETLGAYLTRTGMWVHSHRWEPDDPSIQLPIRVMGACGTCLMVRRSVFEMLGGFDGDFIVYYDDADFSWRAWLAGYQAIAVPRSVIRHWGGGTTHALPSAFTVYHSFKNRLCSLIKLLEPLDLMLVLPVHFALCLAGAGAYAVRFKPQNSLAVLRAVAWNARHLRATLRKRKAARGLMNGQPSEPLRGLIRSLPLRYFMRTSLGYVTKW